MNGDICKTACPFKVYNDNPGMLDADKRRASCTPSFNVVGVNTADMMPVMIRCSGISAGAARNLITLLTFHKDIKGKPYKVTMKVTSVTKQTPFGPSFAIAFGQPTPIADPALLGDLKLLTEQLTGIEIGPEIDKVQATVKQIAAPEPTPMQKISEQRRAEEAAMTPEAKAARAAQAEKDANILFPPDPSNEAAKAKTGTLTTKMDF
jgi:hypothetical protein